MNEWVSLVFGFGFGFVLLVVGLCCGSIRVLPGMKRKKRYKYHTCIRPCLALHHTSIKKMLFFLKFCFCYRKTQTPLASRYKKIDIQAVIASLTIVIKMKIC